MVKLLQVPVDNPHVNNMNPAQVFWYSFMIRKDKEEVLETNRDYLEYLAAFINPEGVSKIKSERENAVKISDTDFEKGIRNLFGRTMSADAKMEAIPQEAAEKRMSARDIINTPIDREPKKKGSLSIEDITKYTGLELDSVKFYPKK